MVTNPNKQNPRRMPSSERAGPRPASKQPAQNPRWTPPKPSAEIANEDEVERERERWNSSANGGQ